MDDIEPTQTVRVLHVITSLNLGGAEMMLLKVLKYQEDSNIENTVLTVLDEGELRNQISQYAVNVCSLSISKILRDPRQLLKSIRTIKRLNYDVIQGWMYHGNFFASIISLIFGGKKPVIWNLRCSEPSPSKLHTQLFYKLCTVMSRHPDYIIANSNKGLDYHKAIGYKLSKASVIPNGVDTREFKFSDEHRIEFRNNWDISSDAFVIGILASHREIKGYQYFLQAIHQFTKNNPDVVFVAGGRDVVSQNSELQCQIDTLGIETNIKLLGKVHDVPQFMSGLDVFTLASVSEGFPNVIVEAMSCARTCVVTDSGDSSLIVGEGGKVVRVRSSVELCSAWQSVYEMSHLNRIKLEKMNRERVVAHYGITSIVSQYKNLYYKLLRKY